MNSLLFVVFALGLAPAPKSPSLEDGFYEILDKGQGTHFSSNDGQTVLLGKNLGKEFGTPSIHSLNNDNTQFGVFLKGAARLWDGPQPPALAVVIDNVCMRITGNSIPDPAGMRDLWLVVNGNEIARRVARVLKCSVELRSDPGHRLIVKWTPDKEHYTVGDPITLKFELRNVGKESVTFRIGGSQRGPRDNQYRFIAQNGHGFGKGIPDTGDPNNHGGMSWLHTLKPGEVYTANVELGKWFKFDEADSYRVTGIWRLHLEDPARKGFDRGIWDDLVCGQCIVNVEKAKK